MHIGYEDRIKLLCWPTLEERRTFLSLVECYKTIHRLNGLDPTNYFDFPNTNYNLRRNHSLTLTIPSARIDIFKYSFFTRVVKDWNALPKEVAEADTLCKFKSRLKCHMDII